MALTETALLARLQAEKTLKVKRRDDVDLLRSDSAVDTASLAVSA